ncbi:hypothetical protein Tco_1465322 [Tanacetum coccineum]
MTKLSRGGSSLRCERYHFTELSFRAVLNHIFLLLSGWECKPSTCSTVCDVSWTLPIRAKGKVGIPGLLLRSQLAKVAQPDHQWYQVHHGEHISRSYPFRTESDIPIRKRSEEPLSPISKGSSASGGGKTTLKKEARSSYSFHQKNGFARIVLDDRITEHAHESALPDKIWKCLSYLTLLWCFNGDLDLLQLLPISKDPLEELPLVLLGSYLPWELLNLCLRISMEKFSRSSFYPTPLINFLDHIVSLPPDETPSYYQPLLKASRLGQSCLHAPSTSCGSDVCIGLCLLRRLAAPYLLRGLATPYLLRRLVAPYLLRGLATPYLLRRLDALYLLKGLANPYLLRRLAAPYLLRGLATPYLLRRLVASYLLMGPATPYPMRKLATPYLLRGLATPYLLRRLAAPYLMRRLATSNLLRRHCSLAIASGPEVTFFTPAIPVNRSNMEWFCLRNIRS